MGFILLFGLMGIGIFLFACGIIVWSLRSFTRSRTDDVLDAIEARERERRRGW